MSPLSWYLHFVVQTGVYRTILPFPHVPSFAASSAPVPDTG